MHAFLFYFGIPYGAVYSNLVASVICFLTGLGVGWFGRKKIGAWIKEALKDSEEMERRLKEHITSEVDKLRGSQ